MTTKLTAGIVAVLIATVLLGNARPDQRDNAETLRKLEAEFMKAAVEQGSKGYMSYYAEDAVELPNGANMFRGKESIAQTMGFLDQKDNRLTWTPVFADVAASADLGYTFGTYEFHSKDKDGKPIVDHGKYMTVWKKQKDWHLESRCRHGKFFSLAQAMNLHDVRFYVELLAVE